MLSKLAEDLAEQVICSVGYGAPSFGPVRELKFEPCPELESLAGGFVPEGLAGVR